MRSLLVEQCSGFCTSGPWQPPSVSLSTYSCLILALGRHFLLPEVTTSNFLNKYGKQRALTVCPTLPWSLSFLQ